MLSYRSSTSTDTAPSGGQTGSDAGSGAAAGASTPAACRVQEPLPHTLAWMVIVRAPESFAASMTTWRSAYSPSDIANGRSTTSSSTTAQRAYTAACAANSTKVLPGTSTTPATT